MYLRTGKKSYHCVVVLSLRSFNIRPLSSKTPFKNQLVKLVNRYIHHFLSTQYTRTILTQHTTLLRQFIPEQPRRRRTVQHHPLPHYKKTEPLKSISTIPDYDLDKFFAITQAKTSMPIETPQMFQPCYKKNKPLKSISTIPDYYLDKFFAITQAKISMPIETPQMFHGDGHTSENPADFLKLFNFAMRQQSVITSADKLDTFGDYLGTGSQAKIWCKALQSGSKTTWPAFITAFELCWPPIIIVAKTKAEYEKELLEFLLTDKEAGMRTMLYDRECWAHGAWATKAMQLATSTGIAASTLMIWQVRGLLPSIVKDLLKEDEYKDWEAFTKEVKELKGTRLAEKKEQQMKQE
jgi:hypothetical protein